MEAPTQYNNFQIPMLSLAAKNHMSWSAKELRVEDPSCTLPTNLGRKKERKR